MCRLWVPDYLFVGCGDLSHEYLFVCLPVGSGNHGMCPEEVWFIRILRGGDGWRCSPKESSVGVCSQISTERGMCWRGE